MSSSGRRARRGAEHTGSGTSCNDRSARAERAASHCRGHSAGPVLPLPGGSAGVAGAAPGACARRRPGGCTRCGALLGARHPGRPVRGAGRRGRRYRGNGGGGARTGDGQGRPRRLLAAHGPAHALLRPGKDRPGLGRADRDDDPGPLGRGREVLLRALPRDPRLHLQRGRGPQPAVAQGRALRGHPGEDHRRAPAAAQRRRAGALGGAEPVVRRLAVVGRRAAGPGDGAARRSDRRRDHRRGGRGGGRAAEGRGDHHPLPGIRGPGSVRGARHRLPPPARPRLPSP